MSGKLFALLQERSTSAKSLPLKRLILFFRSFFKLIFRLLEALLIALIIQEYFIENSNLSLLYHVEIVRQTVIVIK